MDRTDTLPNSKKRGTQFVPTIALAFLPALVASGTFAIGGSDHPSLVTADAAGCAICHDDLIAGLQVVHAPVVDDCTMCHDVAIEETGTTISLVDQDPSLCIMCHDDLSSAVAGELATPHYPVTESCLTCHEVHASDTPRLLQTNQAELCAACHGSADIAEVHRGQLTEGTACASCHRPHGSEAPKMLVGKHQHKPFADGSCNGCHRDPFGDHIRLRARGERLCTACHSDFAKLGAEGEVVHAALTGARGRAGCLSCHDPHMSDQSHLLLSEGVTLCSGCHDQIVTAAQGPSGHAPAAEDCSNCHLPHSSTYPALLSEEPAGLCRMCHDVDDDDLKSVHLGVDLGRLNCVDCHTPHGNENPSLLAKYLHPPVLDGCDTCHEGSAEQLVDDGESSLCLMCHDTIGEQAEQARVPHAALEVGRCVDCHDAHASSQPNLLASPGGAVCTECHSDQAAGEGEVQHGVIDLIGCQACHLPHGGENEKLLRVAGDELCTSCHVARGFGSRDAQGEVLLLDRFAVPSRLADSIANLRLSVGDEHGHPVPNHRVKGEPTAKELKATDSTFTEAMSCLTCHDPHKGRSRLIFKWGAVSSMESCMHCHPK